MPLLRRRHSIRLLPLGLSFEAGIPIVQATLGCTHREAQVAMHAIKGRSVPEIAKLLGVSIATVKSHRARLLLRVEMPRMAMLGPLVVACLWASPPPPTEPSAP